MTRVQLGEHIDFGTADRYRRYRTGLPQVFVLVLVLAWLALALEECGSFVTTCETSTCTTSSHSLVTSRNDHVTWASNVYPI